MAIFTPDNPSFLQFLNLTTAPDLSVFLQLNETGKYLRPKDPQQSSVLPVDLVDPLNSEDEDEGEDLLAHLPVIDNNHVEVASKEHSAALKSQHTPTSTGTTTFHPSFDTLDHSGRGQLPNGHKGPEDHQKLARRQSITAITILKKHKPSEASLDLMKDLPSAPTLFLSDAADAAGQRGLLGPRTDSQTVKPRPPGSPTFPPRPQSKISTATTRNSVRSLHPTATHRPLFAIPHKIKEQNKDDNRDAKGLLPLTLKLMRGPPKLPATGSSRVSSLATLKVSPTCPPTHRPSLRWSLAPWPIHSLRDFGVTFKTLTKVVLQIGRDQRLLLQKAITLATSTAASRKGVPVVVILG